MFSFRYNNKGIALIFILTMVFVVGVLSALLMGLIQSSHNLNLHQVARTQAYYAGMGALNYALARLRLGNVPGGYVPGVNCRLQDGGCPVGNTLYAYDDFDPPYVTSVIVYILPTNTTGNGVIRSCPPAPLPYSGNNTSCVSVLVNYTSPLF